MQAMIYKIARRVVAKALLVALVLASRPCAAGETLLSSFEGNLSTTLGIDWQSFATSFQYVNIGATQGTQAIQLTTPRTQSVPLRLNGGLDTIYKAFTENTQLRADFTVPATASYREAFFRLQINGGAATIDGADLILEPGATVTGIWNYKADGIFDVLEEIGEIAAFSLQLGMRGPDAGNPPTSVTTVDNIRWFSDVTPGDFNNDTKVDAADYTVWRNNVGSETRLPNDNGLGTPIGDAHYNLWRTNFGSGGAGASTTVHIAGNVPEPASCAFLLCCAVLLPLRRLRGKTSRT